MSGLAVLVLLAFGTFAGVAAGFALVLSRSTKTLIEATAGVALETIWERLEGKLPALLESFLKGRITGMIANRATQGVKSNFFAPFVVTSVVCITIGAALGTAAVYFTGISVAVAILAQAIPASLGIALNWAVSSVICSRIEVLLLGVISHVVVLGSDKETGTSK